ncbi:MAG: hypothetical protein R3F36_08265 [Candidatus Competibacteraceae bacterium]
MAEQQVYAAARAAAPAGGESPAKAESSIESACPSTQNLDTGQADGLRLRWSSSRPGVAAGNIRTRAADVARLAPY